MIVQDDDLVTSYVGHKRTREDAQRQQQPSVATISTEERRVKSEISASFVKPLAPRLREEVLLAADEVFLSTLPESIISEARQLQQRKVEEVRRSSQSNYPLATEHDEKMKRNMRSGCQSTGQKQIEEAAAAAEESHQKHRIDDAGVPVKFSKLLPLLCIDNELAERFLVTRGMHATAKELFGEATNSSK